MTTTMGAGREESGWEQELDGILSGTGAPARRMLTSRRGSEPHERQFSTFIPEDLERATALASRLMRIAEEKGGADGLADAIREAGSLIGEEVPGLVQYALELFVTHYPAARERVRFPSLERRQPNLVLPTAAVDEAGATPPENALDYWREDPLINEHHEHWHLVYPMSGRPSPTGTADIGDRHGELFAYMHEQMLARYDAERLSAGLPRVTQFADYRARIPQGYDPGPLKIWDGAAWSAFRARAAGATLSDLGAPFTARPGARLAVQAYYRDRLLEAARTGKFEFRWGPIRMPLGDVRIDNLGNTEEANVKSVDFWGPGNPANNLSYGNHHNDGHIHFMFFDNVQPFGVMASTATAVRDPVFFRWHKHVDSVFQTYQNIQAPSDFTDRPPARLLGIDVIPVLASGPQENPPPTTEELTTEMLERTVEVQDETGATQEVTITYLSHDDFSYVFRAENPLDTELSVTARVFLAPETQVEDRTAWIEMDRFPLQLRPGANVVARPSDASSVIRKPALKPADLTPDAEPSPETEQQAWCDCGWPYTLLLPRGTASGMAFRLLAMLSDGNDLTLPPTDHCTSISYCGLQDDDYPDTRAMGYPFDRPFAQSISTTVEAHDNWATKPIKIRCRNL